jgi:hypothetical protein
MRQPQKRAPSDAPGLQPPPSRGCAAIHLPLNRAPRWGRILLRRHGRKFRCAAAIYAYDPIGRTRSSAMAPQPRRARNSRALNFWSPADPVLNCPAEPGPLAPGSAGLSQVNFCRRAVWTSGGLVRDRGLRGRNRRTIAARAALAFAVNDETRGTPPWPTTPAR